MILAIGEKVHVAFRRNFEMDLRRHFIGTVVAVNESVMRVDGYLFIYGNNSFHRKNEMLTKIVSMVDSLNIINVIPDDTILEDARYETSENGHLKITDGNEFMMEINEFSSNF